MATTWVSISREEVEQWLTSLPWRWTRDQQKAGVYFVHLSDYVGVKVQTTIGSSDVSKDYAQASTKMALVSLVTHLPLNKKDADRSHFKRTTNWRKTWADGVKHWASVYDKASLFYDKIARVEDRDKYKNSVLEAIHSIENWKENNILVDLENKASQGGVLSDKQEDLILQIKNRQTPKSRPSESPSAKEHDEERASQLRSLYKAAVADNNEWLISFLKDVGPKVVKGYTLSDKQNQVIDRNLSRYGI